MTSDQGAAAAKIAADLFDRLDDKDKFRILQDMAGMVPMDPKDKIIDIEEFLTK